jgi:hypothetical protein
MLAHQKPRLGRQIKHLSTLRPHKLGAAQAAAATIAALRLVRHHLVWNFDLSEMMTLAPRLTARLTP